MKRFMVGLCVFMALAFFGLGLAVAAEDVVDVASATTEAAPEVLESTTPTVSDFMVAVKGGDWLLVVVYAGALLWGLLNVSKHLMAWKDAQAVAASNAQTMAERARYALKERVVEWAQGAAAEVYEEYYRDIKAKAADGQLTAEEQAAAKVKARELAVQKILTEGKAQGLDLVAEFGKPMLKALTEQAVSWLKSRYNKPAVAASTTETPAS